MSTDATLYDYWMAIYRQRRAIAVVVAASAVFALVISLLLPSVYEAKTTLYMPMVPAKVNYTGQGQIDLAQQVSLPAPDEKAAAASIGIIKSRTIARSVQQQFPKLALDDIVKNTDVIVGKEFLTEIYYRDRDPQRAAAVANAYAATYDRFQSDDMAARSARTRTVLSRQLSVVKDQLVQQRLELQKFEEESGVISNDETRARLADQVRDFRSGLETTRADLAATTERVKTLQHQLAVEKGIYKSNEAVTTNPQIERLKEKIADLESTLAGNSANVRGSHRRITELQAELAQTKTDLHDEISSLIGSASKTSGSVHENLRQNLIEQVNEQKYLEAKAQALQVAVANVQDNIKSLAAKLIEHETLTARNKDLISLQKNIEMNLVEAGLQEKYPPSSIVVSEAAMPPESPAFPLPILNTLVALLLGLVVGCYYALFLEYLARLKVRRVKDNIDWVPLVKVEQHEERRRKT